MEQKISKTEIKTRFVEMVAGKFGVNVEDVQPQSSFTGDLGADSLDIVEMVMAVEKTFGVSIPDTDTQRFKTVGDVVDYLEEKVGTEE